MKYAITPRREMGVRTIFNVLGPLTNPASAPNQVLGVFDKGWVEPLAQVLKSLGSQHVLVVSAEDGLDEISLNGPTHVAELKNGMIQTFTITPEDFGLTPRPLTDIQVNSAEQSLAMIRAALANETTAARDIIALNAGAAIYTAGLASTLQQGVESALAVLAEKSALQTFDQFIQLTQRFSDQ